MTTDPKRARKPKHRPSRVARNVQYAIDKQIARNPNKPASANQLALMDKLGVPHDGPGLTAAEANELIKAAMPPRHAPEMLRVRAEIVKQAAEMLQDKFNEDWQEFYAALERLRDKPDPDIRAVIYGIDRAMGKVADRHEVGGKDGGPIKLLVEYEPLQDPKP